MSNVAFQQKTRKNSQKFPLPDRKAVYRSFIKNEVQDFKITLFARDASLRTNIQHFELFTSIFKIKTKKATYLQMKLRIFFFFKKGTFLEKEDAQIKADPETF